MKLVLFIDDIERGFSKDAIDAMAKLSSNLLVFSPAVKAPFKVGNVSYSSSHDVYAGINYKYLAEASLICLKDLFRRCNWPYFKLLPKRLKDLHTLFKRADNVIKTLGDKTEDYVFLSFWLSDHAVVAARLKTLTGVPSFSLAHGFDLYEWREKPAGIKPFRNYLLQNLNGVFPISKKGLEYMHNNHPSYKHKIRLSHLGTNDYGIERFEIDHVFTLVTCAWVRDIKRVSHVFDVISRLEFPVRWIHFGGSNDPDNDTEVERFNSLASQFEANYPQHIFDNRGDLEKDELMTAFRKTNINLFISLSETEGLPVSMMEAISFGIPILSTDVGGCSELVTSKTGVLVSPELDYDDIAAQITLFKDSDMNTESFRKGVREFWEANFDINKNYDQLFKNIRAISNK